MKKLKRMLAMLLAFSMLVIGLVGCDSKKDDADKEGDNTPQSAETVYPLEITDSSGAVVIIEKEPEKIISVAPNLTEAIYKLGAGDKLVGRSQYCDYPQEVLEVESVGDFFQPDIERIIALEPDVVLTSSLFDEENAKKLKDAGITVVAITEDTKIEGVYEMITTLGKVLNKNSEAADCVDDMKASIDEVQGKVKDLEKPTVYYVVGYGEYGDFTATGDTFISGMLELAGGDNIAKDATGWSISLETLIEADPDIIIIAEFMKDDFINTPNYAELSAVKEGRVYTLDVNMLERQGYRNADGVKALAEIFHPEAFK